VDELRERAREAGVEHPSELKKEELLEALTQREHAGSKKR
jgi:Rho termination factor, N-terminal domain